VEALWRREAVRLAATRLGFSDLICHRIWHWAELGFDRDVAARWAGRAPCIYGCEHASLETFRRQRAAGGVSLQWQVIAHQRTVETILRNERARFPDARTAYLDLSIEGTPEVTQRKGEEWEAADLIVCNSDFTRRSFLDVGFLPERVIAIPTGCPPVRTTFRLRADKAKPNVFLYAGTLSLRKGVHYLIEAWKRVAPPASAQLWLVGKRELPASFFRGLPSNVRVSAPVSRPSLQELYSSAGVLVFPTLCEGRARVVLEAASAGLAILTTPSSGCEDMVEAGVNGWTVKPADSAALADRIAWFLGNPGRLPGMWSASLAKARSWGEGEFATMHARVVADFLATRGIRGNSCAAS
jgi:glycosyltransferase involved in cell wall biosynthesis